MAIEIPVEQSHALYRFFNEAGDLLYVGVTMDPGARWTEHRRKPWWSDVRSATLEPFSSREAALAAERTAIWTEAPLHNVIHARKAKLAGVHEIAQMFDVSRQTVHDWLKKPERFGFPEPEDEIRAGKVWRTADVLAWAEKTGREIHG